ncbi:hypothetical protein CFC21_044306 [Triticum aestivum]|uniref:F-box domain-containing protein n=2 Tax=Triticum aestivum TaxID=4565 RepID=A0A9R1JXJ3_WHEAT|nr:putative F-box/LRR-repeat protein 23 [Triticum aestivum]KAF7033187.1 hypothetical protein CFC21_044306 [Triticum aestivum]
MVKEIKQSKAVFVFPRCFGLRRATRPRHGRKEKERPASRPADWRDWAALPVTALRAIFKRLQTDVLRGTGPGLACASWRRAAVEDPLLWRRIDLASDEDMQRDGPVGWEAMACAAVDRSAGLCESFRGRVDGDFLVYLADRAPLLKSLHVTSSFDMDHNKLGALAMEKLPLLERLVVAKGFFDERMLCAVLDHCPRLRLLDAGGCYTFRQQFC